MIICFATKLGVPENLSGCVKVSPGIRQKKTEEKREGGNMDVRRDISRRGFLAGSAALGALAVTAGMSAAPLVAHAEDPSTGTTPVKKHVWCQMCGLAEM